ncbi:MAG: hypothetical protein ABJO27_06585 [Pseudoruegeria sp.]
MNYSITFVLLALALIASAAAADGNHASHKVNQAGAILSEGTSAQLSPLIFWQPMHPTPETSSPFI